MRNKCRPKWGPTPSTTQCVLYRHRLSVLFLTCNQPQEKNGNNSSNPRQPYPSTSIQFEQQQQPHTNKTTNPLWYVCVCVLSTPFKICVFFFLFLSNRLPRPPSSHEQKKKKPKRTKGGAPLSVNREVTQHLECVSPQLSLSSSSSCYIVNYTHIIQCWNCC